MNKAEVKFENSMFDVLLAGRETGERKTTGMNKAND